MVCDILNYETRLRSIQKPISPSLTAVAASYYLPSVSFPNEVYPGNMPLENIQLEPGPTQAVLRLHLIIIYSHSDEVQQRSSRKPGLDVYEDKRDSLHRL